MDLVIVDPRHIMGEWKHLPTRVGRLEMYVSRGHEIGRIFREHDAAPVIVEKFWERLPLCDTMEQAKAVVMARYVSLHN